MTSPANKRRTKNYLAIAVWNNTPGGVAERHPQLRNTPTARRLKAKREARK